MIDWHKIAVEVAAQFGNVTDPALAHALQIDEFEPTREQAIAEEAARRCLAEIAHAVGALPSVASSGASGLALVDRKKVLALLRGEERE